MDNNQRKAYKETYTILKNLELLEILPVEVISELEENQDENWEFHMDKDVPLEEQNLLQHTKELLSALYVMYICKNENEKQKLKAIFKENEEAENSARGVNSLEELFGKNKEETPEEKIVDNTETEIAKKTSFFESFLGFFKKLFHKK